MPRNYVRFRNTLIFPRGASISPCTHVGAFCMMSACLSVESTELCRQMLERLVALSFDMSGAMFMQPVARQPLPNRLVDEGCCKAAEVDVIRMSVQACVRVCVCGSTRRCDCCPPWGLTSCCAFPSINLPLPNTAMADSGNSLGSMRKGCEKVRGFRCIYICSC